MALTPLASESDPLPTPANPTTFDDDMDRFINIKLPLLATEVDAIAIAFAFNATNSTSTTSIAIGTGTKNYTVEASKSYVKGMFVVAADSAAPSTNYNYGQVLSYDSGTGALSIDVTNSAGSGTKTSWEISQTSPGGAPTTGYTSTGDIVVPAEVYGTGWNGSNEVPTKNDTYDELVKIPTETTIGRVEKATSIEAAAFTADKYIDAERLRDAFNTTGTAPFFAVRAFGNFDGTGTPAFRNSGNCASITDNGVGRYTITFTTAMPDFYAVVPISGTYGSTASNTYFIHAAPIDNSSFFINTRNSSNVDSDFTYVGFIVVG